MQNRDRKMRFGIQTGQQNTTWDELVKIWKEADDLGFDTAWNFDHFIPIFSNPNGPCLEAWTCAAALAAQTSRIRVGTMVTGNTYRHPAILANMATTVDIISKGRLELGIGAGWFELEHKAYGIPYPKVSERIRRLDEAVHVIKQLWTEKKANFEGRYYTLTDALCEPKPLQQPHPPVMIGGGGEQLTLRVVARHANEWNTFGSPAFLQRKIAILEEHCHAIRRDANEIEKSVLIGMTLTDDREKAERAIKTTAERRGMSLEEAKGWALAGTPEEIQKQIEQFLDVGVTHIILTMTAPYDDEGLRRFAREVMPSFRK
ncbi:MAG: LLM class F420-dependent oxidoreductase [Candidatus Tectomicrobia bacterium]|nr:LLM class F420-dependent oxidoreductase [Candidatus Tectomicrobia bacterium]